MFTEENFIKIHKFIIKFLKRRFEVYSDKSISLGISYDKKSETWFIQPLFDQRLVGNATLIDFCGEQNHLMYLEGSGKTPEEALKILQNKLKTFCKKKK